MASWSYLFPGRFLGSSAIAASPPEGTRTFPVPIESYRNEGINSTVGKSVNRVRVEPLESRRRTGDSVRDISHVSCPGKPLNTRRLAYFL